MQKLCLNGMTPSVRNVGRNCHWVFGFFTTMCQFTSHLLHSKLFTTVDFFNWTTLPTVQIYILITVIRSEIWNLIFMVPVCRQCIGESCCWSVVSRAGRIILFSRHKKLTTRKVTKMHWHHKRLYRKMTVLLKFCCYFLYQSCKTFWSLLVQHTSCTIDNR